MAYLMPVSQMLNRHRGVERIGDTLFIDGSPHVECQHCGIPIKLHDSRKIVIGYWPPKEQAIVVDASTNIAAVEVVHRPPILKSVHGCADCANEQNMQQQAQRGSSKPLIVFYHMKECVGARNGLTAGKLPEIRKKTWTEGQKSNKGFNTRITR